MIWFGFPSIRCDIESVRQSLLQMNSLSALIRRGTVEEPVQFRFELVWNTLCVSIGPSDIDSDINTKSSVRKFCSIELFVTDSLVSVTHTHRQFFFAYCGLIETVWRLFFSGVSERFRYLKSDLTIREYSPVCLPIQQRRTGEMPMNKQKAVIIVARLCYCVIGSNLSADRLM